MTDRIGSIKACGYRVMVEPESGEKKTDSGLIIADSKGRSEQEIGKLVAVGSLAWTDYGDGKPWAEVGDRVLYSKYGGKMISDPGSGIEYRILSDEDIVAVIYAETETFDANYHGDPSEQAA